MARTREGRGAVVLYFEKDVHKALQHYAVDAERPLSAILEQVVTDWWATRAKALEPKTEPSGAASAPAPVAVPTPAVAAPGCVVCGRSLPEGQKKLCGREECRKAEHARQEKARRAAKRAKEGAA